MSVEISPECGNIAHPMGMKAAHGESLAEGSWQGGDSLTKEANSELLKTAIKQGGVKNADGLSAMPDGKLAKVFYEAMKEVGLIGKPAAQQPSAEDDSGPVGFE